MIQRHPEHLCKNDRIVFLGDSITEAQLYTNYVETYLALRYPDLNLTFFNAGWGGDTAPGGLARLDRDVLALKPTVVTICYGMNDGGYTLPTQAIRKQFVDGMNGLVKRLKKERIRIILLTPGFADAQAGPHVKAADYNNNGLRILAGEVLKLAKQEKLPVFDIHTLMTQVDAAGKKADPAFCMAMDGVHPTPAGHLVMAHGLLHALGVAPCCQEVSADIRGNVVAATPQLSAGVAVDHDTGCVRFTIHLDTLPFYVEPAARSVLPFLPFQETFNSLTLAVAGIGTNRHFLRLSPQRSTPVTTAEMAVGVNLFDNWRSQCMQDSADILRFVNDKNQVYYKLWRSLALNNTNGALYDAASHGIAIRGVPRLERVRASRVRRAGLVIGASLVPASLPGEQIDNGDFIATWSFRGPFPRPFAKDYLGGEARFTAGVPRLGSGWKHTDLALENMGDGLGKIYGPVENCSAYALTIINSPVDQECELLLGSDDGFAVWLNGRCLGSHLDLQRGVTPDQDRIPGRLKAGRNTLMVKVSQDGGGWGFCVRFAGLGRVVSATRAKG